MGSTFHTIQVLFSQNRHGRVAISEDVARPVCKLCYAKPYRRLPGYATLRYASLRLTRRHRLLHHAKVDTSFCILPYRAKYCDRLVLQLSARSSVPRQPSCYLTRRHSGCYLQMVWVSRTGDLRRVVSKVDGEKRYKVRVGATGILLYLHNTTSTQYKHISSRHQTINLSLP